MADKAELFKKLEMFLKEKVPAGAGGDYMAKPTDEHMKSMYDIFYDTIALKFEGDCDGDLPIHVDITDYTKHIPLAHLYECIPQFGGTHGDERHKLLKESVKALANNVSNASDNLGRYMQLLDNIDKRGE